jgi:hypothetical protein
MNNIYSKFNGPQFKWPCKNILVMLYIKQLPNTTGNNYVVLFCELSNGTGYTEIDFLQWCVQQLMIYLD